MSSNSTWLFTYNNRHMGGVQVLLQAIINLDCIVDVYKKDRNFILKQIDKMKVTHISATPTFYRMLLPFEKVYENVSRVTVGGERSDTKTIKFIKEQPIFIKTTYPGARQRPGSCAEGGKPTHHQIAIRFNNQMAKADSAARAKRS